MTGADFETHRDESLSFGEHDFRPFGALHTAVQADLVVFIDLDAVLHHEAGFRHSTRNISMSPYEAAAIRFLTGFHFWKRSSHHILQQHEL